MTTEAHEADVAEARGRTLQDRRNPFLIHVDDGRLVPNTVNLRKHPKYRVFTGSPKASPAERRLWLATMSGEGRRVVQDSTLTEAPFDIGKATREELAAFALSEYSQVLNLDMHLATMRAEVRRLAEAHGSLRDNLA